MKYKYVVELPHDRKMKDIRGWLLEHVGQPGEDWSINVDVDLEVIKFFGDAMSPSISHTKARLTEVFNIGFTNEEDKVKFILSFL